jgi:HD-GYP domain-containing protein (c-di-GMP phosphodiesterase class II)
VSDRPPRKFEVVEKIKVAVGELKIGMYICELDRPWLETPFLFQGFTVNSEADIDEVSRYCQYVYVDTLRTKINKPELGHSSGRSYFKQIQPKRVVSFQQELDQAKATRQATTNLVKSFVEDVKFGRALDVQLAKSAVSECVSSLMRNQEALMYLMQIKNKDDYTSQHSFNVCIYSIVLGRFAGLNAKELEAIGTCGLLHDMGKISVPLEILTKEGKLENEEFETMKLHTVYGRDILMSGRNIFSGTVDVAYGHHENLDGSGYPRGLQESQLNLNTKIVAVVDQYDAITSNRCYQKGRTHLDAIQILNKIATARQIDRNLTLGFISSLGVYPPGSIVELTSGEVAIVVESNPGLQLRPQILIVRDRTKKPIAPRPLDLRDIEKDKSGQAYGIKSMRPLGGIWHRSGGFPELVQSRGLNTLRRFAENARSAPPVPRQGGHDPPPRRSSRSNHSGKNRTRSPHPRCRCRPGSRIPGPAD